MRKLGGKLEKLVKAKTICLERSKSNWLEKMKTKRHRAGEESRPGCVAGRGPRARALAVTASCGHCPKALGCTDSLDLHPNRRR